MTYYDRLKKARTDKKLTQRGLAELVSIAPGSLASYEKGTKVPPVDVACRLAKALDVSLDWLFDDKMDETQVKATARSLGDVARAFHMLCSLGVSTGLKLKAVPVEWSLETDFAGKPYHEALVADSFDGEDEFEPNGFCAEITIKNHSLSSFIGGYEKLYELYRAKTIDWDMFSAWIEKQLPALDQIPVQQESED